MHWKWDTGISRDFRKTPLIEPALQPKIEENDSTSVAYRRTDRVGRLLVAPASTLRARLEAEWTDGISDHRLSVQFLRCDQ